jgi:hypothetical protein
MPDAMYALRIKEVDLGLLTLLNNGVTPEVTKTERWLLFKIFEDGFVIHSQILTKRELFKDFDIKGQTGHSPMILRMKRCVNE